MAWSTLLNNPTTSFLATLDQAGLYPVALCLAALTLIAAHINHNRNQDKYHAKFGPAAILSIWLLGSNTAHAESTTIFHPEASQLQNTLILDILKLAIRKSGTGHLYAFEAQGDAPEIEQIAQIQNGDLSVMWAGAQAQTENQMTPIRIPILKGLLGHRIFIIREENQRLFDEVETLDELRSLSPGQARFTEDAAILKYAKMNLVDPVKHENLFKMLEGGRFDYFPRAVHEPWLEVENHRNLPLAIEEKILLVYPYAMYFFVSKPNSTLKNTIETGFRTAIEDGSFDQLFFNHELVRNALENSNFKSRRIIRLQNPNINATTYEQNSELWLNVENM